MGMSNIARKSRLAQNLDFMRRKFPKEFRFYPRSFVLPQEVRMNEARRKNNRVRLILFSNTRIKSKSGFGV